MIRLLLNTIYLVVNTCTNCPAYIKNGMYGRFAFALQTIPGLYISLIVQINTPQFFIAGNP